MKKVLVCTLFLVISYSLFAQNWLWGVAGRNAQTDAFGLAIDKAANAFITGSYQDSVKFGSTTLKATMYTTQTYLVKLDLNGNVLWAKTSKGIRTGHGNQCNGYGAVCDKFNNIIITGNFSDSILLGNDTIACPQNTDNFFVAKFDGSGNLTWARISHLPSQTCTAVGQTVTVDKMNNIYVTGFYCDTASFGPYTLYNNGLNNAFLAKYDSSGNIQWVVTSNAPAYTDWADPFGLTIDNAGNIYETGYFHDTVSFGASTLISNPAISAGWLACQTYLVKYDNNGNLLWAWQTHGKDSSFSKGFSVITDKANNVYLTGTVYDTISLGSYKLKGNNVLNLDVYGDIFLAKLAPNGQVIWAKQSHSNSNGWSGYSLYADTLNNIYFSGGGQLFYNSPTTLSFAGDTFNITTRNREPSFIMGLDTSGHSTCGTMINGAGDDLNTVVCNPTGKVVYFSGDLWADTVVFDTSTLYGGYEVPFVARWQGCCPSLSIQTSSTPTSCSSQNGTATITINGDTANLHYVWSPIGGTNKTATGLSAGSYTVTVTYSNTCSQSTAVTVPNTNGFPVHACCSTTITSGNSALLNVTPGASYSWTPAAGLSCTNCQNPIASPTVTTTYYVTETDSNGCTATDSVLITVLESVKCDSLFIPNAFSPNNDGQNDIFYVHCNCINSMDLVIYDRWGNKVFESENINDGWDGTYRGEPMNSAAFVYYFKAIMNDGNVVNKKGTITLVR